MFFNFNEEALKKFQEKREKEAEPEGGVNEDGSAKFFIGPDGHLVVNDPSLLLSKEVSKEAFTPEDLTPMMFFVGGMWAPLSARNGYSQ